MEINALMMCNTDSNKLTMAGAYVFSDIAVDHICRFV